MKKWKLLGAAYLFVFAGLILLAFRGDVFGADFYTLPLGVTYMEGDNVPGGDADSASADVYGAGAYIRTVPLDTADATTDNAKWFWFCDTATMSGAGKYHVVYRVHDGTDTLLASENIFVVDTLHANPADYKDGGSGSGAYPCSVLVFDGSDNRAGASVYLANTDTIYNVSTNAAGLSIFNLWEGTYYTYLAYPPYTQDSNPDTLVCTTAGGFDTLFCSGPTIASPPSANLCTIYGWPSIHPTDTLRGAKVTVKSKSTKSWVMDTSTNKVWGQIVIRDSTDYNGRMQINVPKSNYLLPGYNMKYDLIVEKQGYPKIQFEITVPDSTQAHLSSCIKQE